MGRSTAFALSASWWCLASEALRSARKKKVSAKQGEAGATISRGSGLRPSFAAVLVVPFCEVGGQAFRRTCQFCEVFAHRSSCRPRLRYDFNAHLCAVHWTLSAFEHHHSALDSTRVGHARI